VNLIDGRNVFKDKFADSVQVELDWQFDAGQSMDIQFENQQGKVILPTNFKTTIKYHFDDVEVPIEEE